MCSSDISFNIILSGELIYLGIFGLIVTIILILAILEKKEFAEGGYQILFWLYFIELIIMSPIFLAPDYTLTMKLIIIFPFIILTTGFFLLHKLWGIPFF
jgi:hypothetical protein